MPNYGAPLYGAPTLYGSGSPATVTEVEIITPTLVKFTLSASAVVDANYFDVANYSVVLKDQSTTDARPKRVLQPYRENSEEEAQTASYIYLVTEPLTIGSVYTFQITGGVQGSDKILVASFGDDRTARRTKAQNAINALPPHFDRRATSRIANLITAIAISDDRIGGSERERV